MAFMRIAKRAETFTGYSGIIVGRDLSLRTETSCKEKAKNCPRIHHSPCSSGPVPLARKAVWLLSGHWGGWLRKPKGGGLGHWATKRISSTPGLDATGNAEDTSLKAPNTQFKG